MSRKGIYWQRIFVSCTSKVKQVATTATTLQTGEPKQSSVATLRFENKFQDLISTSHQMLLQTFSDLLLRIAIYSWIILPVFGRRLAVRWRCRANASSAARDSYRLWDGGLCWGVPLRYGPKLDVVVRLGGGLRVVTKNPITDEYSEAKNNEEHHKHCGHRRYEVCVCVFFLGLSLGVAKGAGSIAVRPTFD